MTMSRSSRIVPGDFWHDTTHAKNLLRIEGLDFDNGTVRMRRMGFEGVPRNTPAITTISLADLVKHYRFGTS